MDEHEERDASLGGDLEPRVSVSECGAGETPVAERRIDGSSSEGVVGVEDDDGACNGDDIMVEVLGSDVYVDGVCTNKTGGNSDEMGEGGSVNSSLSSESDVKSIGGDGDGITPEVGILAGEENVEGSSSRGESVEDLPQRVVTEVDAEKGMEVTRLDDDDDAQIHETATRSQGSSVAEGSSSKRCNASNLEGGVGSNKDAMEIVTVVGSDEGQLFCNQGDEIVSVESETTEIHLEHSKVSGTENRGGDSVIVSGESHVAVEDLPMMDNEEISDRGKLPRNELVYEDSEGSNQPTQVIVEAKVATTDGNIFVNDQKEIAVMDVEEKSIIVEQATTRQMGQELEEVDEFDTKAIDYGIIKQTGSSMLHQARYQLPQENEDDFSVSDLVWGKVRSHPWWPGQIFDPDDSSEKALRHYKKDCFLVAYFGDRTFAWNESSHLKPFRTYFSQIEKQSNSESFQNAVDCALEEVSRRVELGLACACTPKDAYEKIEFQIVENTGISEELSRRDGVDESVSACTFEPAKLIQYMRELAQFPSGGGVKLELVIAKSQLMAFYRLKGYCSLPEFQFFEGMVEMDTTSLDDQMHSNEFTQHAAPVCKDDKQTSSGQEMMKGQRNTSSLKRKHNLQDGLYSKKERSMSDLMGDTMDDDDNLSDERVTASFDKKRKIVDADDSTNTDGRKMISSAKVSNTTHPKQSFKIGDCIRRVASQLTGTPSIVKSNSDKFQMVDGTDVVDDQKGGASFPVEYSSLDGLLSQLQLAATDPLKGHDFLNVVISFFSDFRDSIVLTKYRVDMSTDKVSGKRKTSSHGISVSPEAFEFEDMSDTYWTDRVIQNGSEEQPLRKSRKRDLQLVVAGPEKSPQGNRRPNSRKRYSVGNHTISTEKPVGSVNERSPAELMMNFSEVHSVPSENTLNKMFRRFGPLNESETEVDRQGGRARVIFKKRSDAEVALSSAGKFNIFGPTLVNYQLSYTPSTTFKAPPVDTSHDQEMHLDLTATQYQDMQLDLASIQDHDMHLDLSSLHDQDMQLDLSSIQYQEMECAFASTHDMGAQPDHVHTKPDLSSVHYEERQYHLTHGHEMQPDFTARQEEWQHFPVAIQGHGSEPDHAAANKHGIEHGHATFQEQEQVTQPDYVTTEQQVMQPDFVISEEKKLDTYSTMTQEQDTQPGHTTAQQLVSDRATTQEQESDRATAQEQESVRATAQEQESDRATAQEQESDRAMAQEQESDRATAQEQESDRATAQEQESDRDTAQEQEPDRATAHEQEPDHATAQEQDAVHATTREQDAVHATTREQEPDHATTREQEPDHATTREQEPDHATTREQETDHALAHEQEQVPESVQEQVPESAMAEELLLESDLATAQNQEPELDHAAANEPEPESDHAVAREDETGSDHATSLEQVREPDHIVNDAEEEVRESEDAVNETQEQVKKFEHAVNEAEGQALEPDCAINEAQKQEMEPDHATNEAQEEEVQADHAMNEAPEQEIDPDRATTPTQEREMRPDHVMDEAQEQEMRPDHVMDEAQEQEMRPGHATTQEQEAQPDCATMEEQRPVAPHFPAEEQQPDHTTNQEQQPDHTTTQEQRPVHTTTHEQKPDLATTQYPETHPDLVTTQMEDSQPHLSTNRDPETLSDRASTHNEDMQIDLRTLETKII